MTPRSSWTISAGWLVLMRPQTMISGVQVHFVKTSAINKPTTWLSSGSSAGRWISTDELRLETINKTRHIKSLSIKSHLGFDVSGSSASWVMRRVSETFVSILSCLMFNPILLLFKCGFCDVIRKSESSA